MSELYQNIALGLASHLKKSQVLQENQHFSLSTKNRSCKVELDLFNQKQSHALPLVINKSTKMTFKLTINNTIKVEVNQFFKITPTGILTTVEGFKGLPSNNKSIKTDNQIKTDDVTAQPSSILTTLIKNVIRKVPYVFEALKEIKEYLLPEPKTELSGFEGVVFRIQTTEKENSYILECYDHGGIYDYHLNAEGLSYPNQVAGNYYADIYSVLLFLQLFERTNQTEWFERAKLSWNFIKRIYPQYQPSNIVWHHSDFKNAGVLEVIQQYGNKYPEFSNFPHQLVEDHYEPTNVFALRCHWKSLAQRLGRKEDAINALENDYAKLSEDQTLDGLFHDNIAAYPDAHDLTYHQYSCACIAQALEYRIDNDKKALFMKAVRFTLNVMGPNGEPSYLGRASNNLHHSASAILAFHKAAELTDNEYERKQFLKAASVCAERMLSFQQTNGMIPTGLNHEINLRMAWNHCETPYNALAGYFLLRALDFHSSETATSEIKLPLEKQQTWLANDAGFATLSNGNSYLVIFSGCDKSYAWSEGKHITGGAGIALFGQCGKPSLMPCLDLHYESDIFVSDLPTINGELPFGRGELILNEENTEITLKHNYGDAQLHRVYKLTNHELLVTTSIISECNLAIEGKVRWPILINDTEPLSDFSNQKLVIRSGEDNTTLQLINGFSEATEFTESKTISNAKGFVKVLSIDDKCELSSSITYSHKVTLC